MFQAIAIEYIEELGGVVLDEEHFQINDMLYKYEDNPEHYDFTIMPEPFDECDDDILFFSYTDLGNLASFQIKHAMLDYFGMTRNEI
ncbi:MAG: hypothetical protein ACRCWQ_14820 [Bacilli bacterium]